MTRLLNGCPRCSNSQIIELPAKSYLYKKQHFTAIQLYNWLSSTKSLIIISTIAYSLAVAFCLIRLYPQWIYRIRSICIYPQQDTILNDHILSHKQIASVNGQKTRTIQQDLLNLAEIDRLNYQSEKLTLQQRTSTIQKNLRMHYGGKSSSRGKHKHHSNSSGQIYNSATDSSAYLAKHPYLLSLPTNNHHISQSEMTSLVEYNKHLADYFSQNSSTATKSENNPIPEDNEKEKQAHSAQNSNKKLLPDSQEQTEPPSYQEWIDNQKSGF